ncbi:discoidin domain-containing protein [Acetobacter indonesiensis]|uniref:discoidin domain-containing protein n=1 Tax=Acetobacter indonesiensis TaxID=104101 RepID=UPI0011778DED|nr:discoidin domain-containing protein [Acetobacter indonesiensis]
MTDLNADLTHQYVAYPLMGGERYVSATEWFPWVDLNLGKQVSVRGFELSGWERNSEQPPLLTVMLSENGKDWLPVWTQPYHKFSCEKYLFVDFERTFVGQYVRLRIDGYGKLDFSSLNILFSNPKSDDKQISSIFNKIKKEASLSKLVLSTLFNESDVYLNQYINNFLAMTPDNVFLVLNFPKDRIVPDNIKSKNHRVCIFNGSVNREKWGHTLLLGHIEAFQKAKEVFPDFSYFATMASNALMVRELDVISSIAQLDINSPVPVACERAYDLDIDVDVLEPTHHGTWMWHHFRNCSGLGEYLHDQIKLERVSVTQIEGLFASRQDWQLLEDRKSLLEGLAPFISFENFLALEEVLPIAIFRTFGSGRYTHICRVLWSGTREVTVDDLLTMVPRLPEYFCSLKWFDRSASARSTIAVTTEWGRQLLDLARKKKDFDPIERFQASILARQLVDQIRDHEKYLPLTMAWWDTEEKANAGVVFDFKNIPCQRQILKLDILDEKVSKKNPAYIYMEETGLVLDVSISINEINQSHTNIRIACAAQTQAGDLVSGVHLQGYLYLSALCGSTVFRINISKDKCHPPEMLSRTVLHDEYNYRLINAEFVEKNIDSEILYYVCNAAHDDGQVWLGLPICSNGIAEISVSVEPNPNLMCRTVSLKV